VIEFSAHGGVPFLSPTRLPIGQDHAQLRILKGQKMKKLALTAALIGLGLAVAAPAQAAKKHRHTAGSGTYAMTPGGSTGEFHRGVLKGPLYNGQEYLGDDPDPTIRAYLLRDLDSRYGGGR
jgi:hypothetical protein